MSLSAREQQALHAMEDAFARSDPKLTFMLAAFTRLTSGEEMPAREQLPHRARRWRRLRWQRAIVMVLLTAAVGAFAAGLAVSRGGAAGRTVGRRPCPAQAHFSGCPHAHPGPAISPAHIPGR